MAFKQFTSAHGTIHPSEAEANAASRWIPLGFDAYDNNLPVAYTCPEEELRTGRSDFLDTTFGFLIEHKVKSLNAKKNKTFADRGMARLDEQVAGGWIAHGSNKYNLEVLKTGWNHAAAQIAAKQRACHAAGYVYILIFSQQPDEATLKLLIKYDILWLKEKSHEWQQYMLWRKLASIPGINVQVMPLKDWQITLH